MAFNGDLAKFSAKLERRARDVFVDSVTEVRRSVVDGSAITTAPGQPVQTGALKNSWQLAFPSRWSAELTTNIAYARPIEEGVGRHGPLILRSSVGGFHSVKKTRVGWQRIVEHVTREVAR